MPNFSDMYSNVNTELIARYKIINEATQKNFSDKDTIIAIDNIIRATSKRNISSPLSKDLTFLYINRKMKFMKYYW